MEDTKTPSVSEATAYTAALCGSREEQHRQLAEYALNPDRLWNDNVITGEATTPLRDHEQPHHRVAVLLKAQGLSTNEIAETLGYTASTISVILRQPWARKLLTELIMRHGRAGIERLLEAELIPSILTLVEVRDSPTAPPSTRVAAADKLLDRFLGKPTAFVETTTHQAPASDVETLQRQLDNLRAEEARLKAN
jgi:CRP-like cAMP-binding protein